jgi:hypothetical protein
VRCHEHPVCQLRIVRDELRGLALQLSQHFNIEPQLWNEEPLFLIEVDFPGAQRSGRGDLR